MEIGRMKLNEPTRVGELLIKAGIISQAQLNDALILARKTATPVGRILIMSGSLRERDLQTVLKAQALLRSRKIAYDLAVKTIYTARQSAIDFEEALDRQGYQESAPSLEGLGELAELLLLSEVLTQGQLQSAIERSKSSHIPLGRTLVLMGLVSPSVMATALNAQVLLRSREIRKTEAVQGIKIALTRRVSLEQALIQEGTYQPRSECWLRLGELFALAGMLSETDNLWAVEASLEERRPFGQILLEAGLVLSKQLDAALELQRMISEKLITGEQAAELMKGVNSYNMTVQEAYKQLKHFGSQVVSLLKMSNIINDAQINNAKQRSVEPIVDLSVYLYEMGVIDAHTLRLGRDCLKLIREDQLKINQVVVLLNYCTRSRIGIQDALQELAWDEPVRTEAVEAIQESLITRN
jgi:hypothetical protein